MLTSLLLQFSKSTPEKTAVVFEGKTITYGAMGSRIEQSAKNLADLGLGPGKRAVLSLANSIDYLVLYYALARIGATIAVRVKIVVA